MRVWGLMSLSALACVLASGVHAQQVSPNGKSEQVTAGKKRFVQRCSVCHLPPLGPGANRPYARLLNEYIKSPDSVTRAREVIQKGTAGMPGFQYTLQPDEIENVIAYIGTLK